MILRSLHIPAISLPRLLAVLLLVLSTALAGTSLSAQDRCEDGNCKVIKVYNTTKYEYKMQFLLCCDGEQRVTDCDYYVPADDEVKFDFSPCTVLRFRFCDTLPDNVCYYWDENECYIKIYYCN